MTSWSVGYLPTDRESIVNVAGSTEEDAAAAMEAAAAALIALIFRVGRCEFRMNVGGVPVTVVPGLTVEGGVDVDGLSADLVRLLDLEYDRTRFG